MSGYSALPMRGSSRALIGPTRQTGARTRRRFAVALAILAFGGAGAEQALGVASFRTPGNAVLCGWSSGEGPAWLICWTPNDGYTISMRDYGRPARGSYNARNIGWIETRAPILRFGRTMAWRPTSCTSRASGLTCTNGSGHGWWLGRFRGVRRF
jgi:hypothetical protein